MHDEAGMVLEEYGVIWMRQLIVGSDGVRGRYGADGGGHGGQGAWVVDEKVSVVRQGVRTCGSVLARESLIRRRFSVSTPVGYLLEQRSIRATDKAPLTR